MWYTIKELEQRLRYIDEDGNLVPLLSEQAIKNAAIKGTVGAKKGERGRWLIDSDSEGARKWFTKKRKAEARVLEAKSVRAKRAAAQKEVEQLKSQVEQLTAQLAEEQKKNWDLSSDLRNCQAESEKVKADAAREVRLAKIKETKAKQELESVKLVSEERERMLSKLLGALSAPQSATEVEKPAPTTVKPSETPKNPSEGYTGEQLYKMQQEYFEKNPHGTKTAFADYVGIPRKTVSDRIEKYLKSQGK